MCKEEVRVKKEYLMEAYPNSYTYDALNESNKDCFTLDEFIEFRKCFYSNLKWGWGEGVITDTKSSFNEALEIQLKSEWNFVVFPKI